MPVLSSKQPHPFQTSITTSAPRFLAPDAVLVQWCEHCDASPAGHYSERKTTCSNHRRPGNTCLRSHFHFYKMPKAATTTPKKSAPGFQLNSPYAAPQWPNIGHRTQTALLKLLADLVAPIGEWRSQIPVSKGKRRKKLKLLSTTKPVDQVAATTVPPPSIAKYVAIGLNSVSRVLEEQAKTSHELAPLRSVFLTHPVTSLQYSHLPILALSAKPSVQLVPLHAGAEKQLCAALALPRAGVIGIRSEAPGAEGLLALLEDVPAVESPFLIQASSGQWLGTKAEQSTGQLHGK
jgi:hypothetical protein